MSNSSNANRGSKGQQAVSGNYKGYYKYRIDADSRVGLFESKWFHDKRCLDIGCNSGELTIRVAEVFRPSIIIGMDSDQLLIDRANDLLQQKIGESALNTVQTAKISSFVPRAVQPPTSAISWSTPPDKNKRVSLGRQDSSSTKSPLHKVQFGCKDILSVSTSNLCDEVFGSSEKGVLKQGDVDTILCLSLTKWIQLNSGDHGLLRLFHTVYHTLAPGGCCILEYQPWKSYINNRGASATTKKYFSEITLRPEFFEHLLESVFGFDIEVRQSSTT